MHVCQYIVHVYMYVAKYKCKFKYIVCSAKTLGFVGLSVFKNSLYFQEDICMHSSGQEDGRISCRYTMCSQGFTLSGGGFSHYKKGGHDQMKNRCSF